MAATNSVIVYLTQNTDVRRTYLKTSLYFLFKHFNAKYQYPVIIFHEGDFDVQDQRDIIMSVRTSCRSLVTFHTLDADDFKIPDWVDKKKLKHVVESRPTPYWRNEKYRLMCNWWLNHLCKYVGGYDYVMRLDDDSIIEEPVTYDLFDWAKKQDLNYASNMMHVDCGICCYGMRDFFWNRYTAPQDRAKLSELFIPQEIPTRMVQFHFFRLWLSITQDPLPALEDKMTLYQPVMMYNNFFILKPSFWKSEAIQETLKAVDEQGGVFYARWGDAPLQSLLCMLHSPPEKVSRCVFAYSKRMQREAFKGDDGELHCYMPDTYNKSSCMTER